MSSKWKRAGMKRQRAERCRPNTAGRLPRRKPNAVCAVVRPRGHACVPAAASTYHQPAANGSVARSQNRCRVVKAKYARRRQSPYVQPSKHREEGSAACQEGWHAATKHSGYPAYARCIHARRETERQRSMAEEGNQRETGSRPAQRLLPAFHSSVPGVRDQRPPPRESLNTARQQRIRSRRVSSQCT